MTQPWRLASSELRAGQKRAERMNLGRQTEFNLNKMIYLLLCLSYSSRNNLPSILPENPEKHTSLPFIPSTSNFWHLLHKNTTLIMEEKIRNGTYGEEEVE